MNFIVPTLVPRFSICNWLSAAKGARKTRVDRATSSDAMADVQALIRQSDEAFAAVHAASDANDDAVQQLSLSVGELAARTP